MVRCLSFEALLPLIINAALLRDSLLQSDSLAVTRVAVACGEPYDIYGLTSIASHVQGQRKTQHAITHAHTQAC